MAQVTFLAGFCSILTAISIVRLTLDADALDAGTTVLVVGITLMTVRLAAIEESIVSWGGSLFVDTPASASSLPDDGRSRRTCRTGPAVRYTREIADKPSITTN